MNIFGIKPKEYEDFKIQRAIVGPIGTNVFFLIHPESSLAWIVDPGAEGELLIQYLNNQSLKLKAILLTHGHEDHIGAASVLRDRFDVPIYCHEKESQLLMDPSMNCSLSMGHPLKLQADILLKEGEELSLENISCRVLHTPGHTAGSCCYYFQAYDTLISGDTLFHGSYGRTDLPSGNDKEMLGSIRRLLTELSPETIVYPGHMDRTSIAFERRFNPLADML